MEEQLLLTRIDNVPFIADYLILNCSELLKFCMELSITKLLCIKPFLNQILHFYALCIFTEYENASI